MNQIMVAGHLGSDPEVRFTSSGKKVVSLRVAARCRRGSKVNETIWWRVSIWGDDFDKMIPHFKKGSAIMVIGEMSKPEIFTDKEGKHQVAMSMTAYNIWFNPFGRPESAAGAGELSQESGSDSAPVAYAASSDYGQGKLTSFSDDEVPF